MKGNVESLMKKCLLVLLAVMLVTSCKQGDRYVSFSGYAQGGTYTVKVNLNGPEGMVRVRPQEIKDSVDAILGRIDASLSGYNRKSLLSRFNSGETIVPDSIFVDIYSKAYDVYDMTGAAVDVSSAPLFDIWGFGFKSGEMPDAQKVKAIKDGCGMSRLIKDMRAGISPEGTLSPENLLVVKDGPLPELNYNAIAQGYSCDLVARYLYSIGIKDMMVDIGEIFCDGVNPSGLQWNIGIDRPVDGNDERGAELQAIFRVPEGPHGVVTSGNYRKYYIRDGRKYAHTIDTRTGYPVSHNLLSATVLAPDALMADAYATYCMVVGLEEAVAFIESSPELEACLVYDEDGAFRMWTSSGVVLSDLD